MECQSLICRWVISFLKDRRLSRNWQIAEIWILEKIQFSMKNRQKKKKVRKRREKRERPREKDCFKIKGLRCMAQFLIQAQFPMNREPTNEDIQMARCCHCAILVWIIDQTSPKREGWETESERERERERGVNSPLISFRFFFLSCTTSYMTYLHKHVV